MRRSMLTAPGYGTWWFLLCLTGTAGCSSAEFSARNGSADAGLKGAGGGSSSSSGGQSASGGDSAGGASAQGGTAANGGSVATGGSTTSAGGTANGGAQNSGGVTQGGAGGIAGAGTGGGGVVGAGGGVVSTIRGCENPTRYHVSNGPQTSTADTGFEVCASSWVAHRVSAMACPLGPTTTDPNQCNPSSCSSDADCNQQPHGFCSEVRHLAGYCGCFYGCMQDSDCGAGNICFCGTPVGTCVPAACKDDSSCVAGAMCATYLAPCDSGGLSVGAGCTGAVDGCFAGFACQSASDECLYDSDCLPDNGRCELRDGRRRCAPVCPGPPPPAP